MKEYQRKEMAMKWRESERNIYHPWSLSKGRNGEENNEMAAKEEAHIS